MKIREKNWQNQNPDRDRIVKIENRKKKSHIRKKSKIWGEWKVGKNRELVGN